MARRNIRFNPFTLGLTTAIFTAAAFSTASCSPVGQPTTTEGATGGAGGKGGGGVAGSGASNTGGEGGGFIDPGTGPFGDFPMDPVVLDGIQPDIGTLFQNTPGADTGGPCLSEPPLDAMFPRNWTPLFFEWNALGDQNIFELKLEVDNQLRPLVVYTTQLSYTMVLGVWKNLTTHSAAHDVKITLRGAHLENGVLTSGPFVGASGVVHIAPVAAPGSVVYWTASGGTSFQGFTIGDTQSKTVLTPAMAGMTSTGGETTCVSCHTSSPDGKLIIYTRDVGMVSRAVDARYVTGGVPGPEVISPSALALLGRNKQSAPVLTSAHYSPNDAIAISNLSDPTTNGGR